MVLGPQKLETYFATTHINLPGPSPDRRCLQLRRNDKRTVHYLFRDHRDLHIHNYDQAHDHHHGTDDNRGVHA
jgi:hypothetical protein